MFGKEEARQLKKDFWVAFGVMMKPHLSAEGLRTNWINYKTGVKDIRFKTNASNKEVYVGIQLTHSDDGIRELYWEQFEEFKTLFHSVLEEKWHWDSMKFDEFGKPYSDIYTRQKGNVFDKNQWPEMFQFLKSRLLKLDEFWCDAKDVFKSLS